MINTVIKYVVNLLSPLTRLFDNNTMVLLLFRENKRGMHASRWTIKISHFYTVILEFLLENRNKNWSVKNACPMTTWFHFLTAWALNTVCLWKVSQTPSSHYLQSYLHFLHEMWNFLSHLCEATKRKIV